MRVSGILAVKQQILLSKYHITRKFLNPHFTLHQIMRSFIIFSLLIVSLLARNQKHLVEVDDKNEINDEKEKNHEDVESVANNEEKNTNEEKNVKPKKVLY